VKQVFAIGNGPFAGETAKVGAHGDSMSGEAGVNLKTICFSLNEPT
jgi:hypothetical protein